LILDRLLDAVQGYPVEGFPPFLFVRSVDEWKKRGETQLFEQSSGADIVVFWGVKGETGDGNSFFLSSICLLLSVSPFCGPHVE
jgi:hypothetical protein